ncbi:MAG: aldo/keto reductase [Clostridia bacterium]|nr:aldo/keto reductase [Clostridia bacterium]
MAQSYLGAEIPKLGFGLMRLPLIGEEIDIEQTKKMVDAFIANGFTYFDTAYRYNAGKSEEAAGEALVKRYPREKFQLATKAALWDVKSRQELEDQLATSLKRTGAGYFDFYLLHNLAQDRIDLAEQIDAWGFIRDAKANGYAKHIGFSFHDTADKLEKILQAHPEAEFVQLQINYADWDDDVVQARKNCEVARKYGRSVIVMEPLRGGLLANPIVPVREVFEAADPSVTAPYWGLRFAASNEGIITVLSGMSNLEQMEQNISYMKDFAPLSEAQQAVVSKAVEVLKSIPTVPCTACRYCTEGGCPAGINIPSVIQALNRYKVYGNLDDAKKHYERAIAGAGSASDCIGCGQCEDKCPQKINIIDVVREASELFE